MPNKHKIAADISEDQFNHIHTVRASTGESISGIIRMLITLHMWFSKTGSRLIIEDSDGHQREVVLPDQLSKTKKRNNKSG